MAIVCNTRDARVFRTFHDLFLLQGFVGWDKSYIDMFVKSIDLCMVPGIEKQLPHAQYLAEVSDGG